MVSGISLLDVFGLPLFVLGVPRELSDDLFEQPLPVWLLRVIPPFARVLLDLFDLLQEHVLISFLGVGLHLDGKSLFKLLGFGRVSLTGFELRHDAVDGLFGFRHGGSTLLQFQLELLMCLSLLFECAGFR